MMVWMAICGDIGASSNALARNLLRIYPQAYGVVLPTTTAPLLDGEQNGSTRHCIDKREFQRLLAAEEIVGHWIVGGRFSGTSLNSILAIEGLGLHPIILIDGFSLSKLQALAEKHSRTLLAVWVQECPVRLIANFDRRIDSMPYAIKASIAKATQRHHEALSKSDWLWEMPIDYDTLLAAYELDQRFLSAFEMNAYVCK